MAATRRYIDIGANLTDQMFKGVYHGSTKHPEDLQSVLRRAWDAGLKKIIITGGNVDESRDAVKLAETDDRLYSTVGCHPTRCREFEESCEPATYLQKLSDIVRENSGKVVAIGECGLDYDRLEFCPKEVQKRYFELQLDLCESTKLPLFLHCRNSAEDLAEILNRNRDRLSGGVVHSFDSSWEHASTFINMDYFIGINGCSLKTEENLLVAAKIPSDKLLIETDCPWCEIRPSHAGFKHIKTVFPSVKKEKWDETKTVKSRNEPCNIVQVLEVLSAIRDEDIDSLCEAIFNNSMKLFFNKN